MKILIFVPSKNRVEIFEKYTFRWLKELMDYKVFLEPQDVEAYKTLGLDDENIVVLPENNQGLGYSLSKVKQYAEDNSYDAVWKIDDDIKSFIRKGTKETGLSEEERTYARADAFRDALRVVEDVLSKKPQVGAIGFPYSFQQWQTEKNIDLDKKLQTSYIVRTNLFSPKPEISTQEDYYAYIRVRMAGYHSARINVFGLDLGVEVGGGTGGLQDFDRATMSETEKELIKQEFPNIVFKKKADRAWGWEVDFKKSNLERK